MAHGPAKRAKAVKRERKKETFPSQAVVRMKRLTLDLHESLHREIKKNPAEEGVTMAEKLRDILTKHYGSFG